MGREGINKRKPKIIRMKFYRALGKKKESSVATIGVKFGDQRVNNLKKFCCVKR